jgi:hypothetical protein
MDFFSFIVNSIGSGLSNLSIPEVEISDFIEHDDEYHKTDSEYETKTETEKDIKVYNVIVIDSDDENITYQNRYQGSIKYIKRRKFN